MIGQGCRLLACLAVAGLAGCGGSAQRVNGSAQHVNNGGSRYAGQKLEQGLAAGWNQYKFQDEPTMAGQLAGAIRGEPLQTQIGAIEAAFEFAGKLVIQQRLDPAIGASKLVADMEHDFPATATTLNKEVNWRASTTATTSTTTTSVAANAQATAACTKVIGDVHGIGSIDGITRYGEDVGKLIPILSGSGVTTATQTVGHVEQLLRDISSGTNSPQDLNAVKHDAFQIGQLCGPYLSRP